MGGDKNDGHPENNVRFSKVSLFCGVVSVSMVILLLLCTQYIWDCSVMLEWIVMFFFVFAVLPFVVMFMSNKKTARTVSLTCAVITIFVCCTLVYRRNKVYYIYVSKVTYTDDEIVTEMMSRITPSGVIVLAGKNVYSLSKSLIRLASLDEATKNTLAERMTRVGIEASIINQLQEPDSIKALKSIRLSGIKRQLIISVAGQPEAAINEDNYRENGFIRL